MFEQALTLLSVKLGKKQNKTKNQKPELPATPTQTSEEKGK